MFQDGAVGHDNHEIRNLSRETHFVSDDNHRHARLGKVTHHSKHLEAQLWVQSGGRLIEQHHVRIECERTRYRDPLLLPAREPQGMLLSLFLKSDLSKQRHGSLVRLVFRTTDNTALCQRDVVENGEVREEVESLEHHPGGPTQSLQAPR